MMIRIPVASVLVALLLVGVPAASNAADADDIPGSVMRLDWEAHLDQPWQFDPPVPFKPGEEPGNDGDLVVFGYLPYWEVGDVTLQLHLLSHLAYFAVAVNGDGSLGDTRHWGQPAMNEIMASAQAEGVTVVLVATAFSATVIESVLSSPTSRAAAIQNLVDAVSAAGGDGVNVDFEGVPASVKTQFVQFVSDLKAAMDAELGESSVTLAMPAVDWKGAYDYDALADACDGLFLMEYDFHWPGGNPGPVSPFAGSDKWGKYSVTWSLDDYDTWGGERNREKFILGLPLYGFDWPTVLSEPPSTAASDATSTSWSACNAQGESRGWNWDQESSSPWYDYYSGDQYHQVWCENPESLSMRLELARQRGLAGVGFWALGYEGDRTEPWQAIVDIWDLDGSGETPDTVEVTVSEPIPDVADDAGGWEDTVIPAVDVPDSGGTDTPSELPGLSDDGQIPDAASPDDAVIRVDGQGEMQVGADTKIPVPEDAVTDTGESERGSGGCQASRAGSGSASVFPLYSIVLWVLLLTASNTILSRRRGRHGRAK